LKQYISCHYLAVINVLIARIKKSLGTGVGRLKW